MAKKARNPYAVCKAMGKKRHWSKSKVEACVRKVKRNSR